MAFPAVQLLAGLAAARNHSRKEQRAAISREHVWYAHRKGPFIPACMEHVNDRCMPYFWRTKVQVPRQSIDSFAIYKWGACRSCCGDGAILLHPTEYYVHCALHRTLCLFVRVRSKGMFWTCDATCKINRQEYEQRRRVYDDLNRDYLQGVAEVCVLDTWYVMYACACV